MHTENSDRGWWLDHGVTENSQQAARRESSERFYASKDALERRDLSSDERRMHENIMHKEFHRERPEPPRDYLHEF